MFRIKQNVYLRYVQLPDIYYCTAYYISKDLSTLIYMKKTWLT